MKTYIATLEVICHGIYFMSYKFFDGDEEVGNTDVSIDEDTYDYIAVGVFQSDLCNVVEGRQIEHTETDGQYHHGTWAGSEPTS